VKRLVQSRTGETGTCFRTAMASILDLREQDVPDWPDANQDTGVNRWLAGRGLRYVETPVDGPTPVGYHFILGTSPRGGQHAVVGINGRLAMDPHPQDGTGRGLVEVNAWGVLVPVGKAEDAMTMTPDKDGEMQLHYTAKDSSATPWALALLALLWRWHKKSAQTESCSDPFAYRPRSKAWDAKGDHYTMREILDTLGIDFKEYMCRTEAQKEALLHTAIKELEKKRKSAHDALIPLPPTPEGRAAYKAGLERHIEQLKVGKVRGQRPQDLENAYEQLRRLAKATDSRRARLHRALDAVMDRTGVGDIQDVRTMYETAKTPSDIAAATRLYNKLLDQDQEPFRPGEMTRLKKEAQERVAASVWTAPKTAEEARVARGLEHTKRKPDLFRRK